jgi:hypothetical protein
MKYLLSLMLLFSFSVSAGEIYMQTNPHGNVVYTDNPSGNAQKIIVNTPKSLPAPVTTTKPATAIVDQTTPNTNPPKVAYSAFEIASPGNNENFQNQHTISVKINIAPALQTGDKIQVFMDGAAWDQPLETTYFKLTQLDRGTHQIFAVLTDSAQQVLKKTNAITVFVHYANNGNAAK